MKRNHKSLTAFLLLISFLANGQTGAYRYQRALSEPSGQWHQVALPDDIFQKTREDLADIRILGITAKGDTIEAPYLLRTTVQKTTDREVSFTVLNATKGAGGYYFTFEAPTRSTINQIDLKFRQNNFDWTVKLEGSQDQHEWFTLAEHYPVMAIKNDQTDFKFSSLHFPAANFRYFRVFIDSSEKPELESAHLSQRLKSAATYKTYITGAPTIKEDRQRNETVIDIDLKTTVPVSMIRINAADQFDYHRPVTIQTVTDSMQTGSGWRRRYATIAAGIISSADSNAINFNSTLSGKLRVLVHNQNNPPLNIRTVEIKGYVYNLVARFTEKASYYLVYGNKDAPAPEYDLRYFSNNIPVEPSLLTAGEEKETGAAPGSPAPLFENKTWLWSIMAIIILALGWFSLKMIQKR